MLFRSATRRDRRGAALEMKCPDLTSGGGAKEDAAVVLTVSFAHVVDPGEVLVAAALVGAFGVVAHVGAHAELETLILIWKRQRRRSS